MGQTWQRLFALFARKWRSDWMKLGWLAAQQPVPIFSAGPEVDFSMAWYASANFSSPLRTWSITWTVNPTFPCSLLTCVLFALHDFRGWLTDWVINMQKGSINNWGNFWEDGAHNYGLCRAHRYHHDLNWTTKGSLPKIPSLVRSQVRWWLLLTPLFSSTTPSSTNSFRVYNKS